MHHVGLRFPIAETLVSDVFHFLLTLECTNCLLYTRFSLPNKFRTLCLPGNGMDNDILGGVCLGSTATLWYRNTVRRVCLLQG